MGFFLTADERLQEESIGGRQRLHPHGHRLHTPLERFSFLKGVLYGFVEHCRGRPWRVQKTSALADRQSFSKSNISFFTTLHQCAQVRDHHSCFAQCNFRYIGHTASLTAFSCGRQVPDVGIPHYRDARMQHSPIQCPPHCTQGR